MVIYTLVFFISQLGIIYFAIFRYKNLSFLSLPLAVLKSENRANLNIGPSKTSQGQVLYGGEKKVQGQKANKQGKKRFWNCMHYQLMSFMLQI